MIKILATAAIVSMALASAPVQAQKPITIVNLVELSGGGTAAGTPPAAFSVARSISARSTRSRIRASPRP
jgi:hypothetical protein